MHNASLSYTNKFEVQEDLAKSRDSAIVAVFSDMNDTLLTQHLVQVVTTLDGQLDSVPLQLKYGAMITQAAVVYGLTDVTWN